MNRRTASVVTIPCIAVLVCLFSFFDPGLGNAAEKAATVLLVSPSVASHQDGKATTLAVKMKVPVSATVISDAAGRAQLMFPDTTTVSIAPGTEIALSEFVDEPNEESIILNMARGTARFITGEVSRHKPSALIVNTPQAIIGIRGTMVPLEISGDTTKVYLTETSGLGVTVTDRKSGEQKKMVRPGNMITISPRGMDERPGKLEEVRRMTVALRSSPRLSDDGHRLPVAVPSVTPAGNMGADGGFDAILNAVATGNTGLDVSLIRGNFAGGGTTYNNNVPNWSCNFEVNSNALISNAFISVYNNGTGENASASGGSGAIAGNGAFNVGNFTPSP